MLHTVLLENNTNWDILNALIVKTYHEHPLVKNLNTETIRG